MPRKNRSFATLFLGAVVTGVTGLSGAAEAQEKAASPEPLAACEDPLARIQLAPTGILRLGFTSVPLWATKDAGSGQLRGLAVELGEALAEQTGAQFAPVVAPNLPKLVEIGLEGAWDVAISVISAGHQATLDYSSVVMLDEATFLVPASSAIRSIADVDRSGTRIVVVRDNPTDTFLKDTIKNADLLRAENPQVALDLVKSGEAEVMALARWNVPGRLKALEGHRALDENFAAQPVALSMLKGKPEAMRCLDRFIERILENGRMAAAISNSGLVGIALPSAR